MDIEPDCLAEGTGSHEMSHQCGEGRLEVMVTDGEQSMRREEGHSEEHPKRRSPWWMVPSGQKQYPRGRGRSKLKAELLQRGE